MVCAHPSQRMAALARLLLSSQRTPDEFAHQKIALQHVHRELREADEANLIDEKDMHIFDLQPMTDPLHLVSCNACRKPIKASQYALHAELCSSLTSIEEIVLGIDGGRKPKKPPRKERKKLVAVNSNQITSVKGAKFEIPDACEVNASQSLLEEPSSEAKDSTMPRDGPGNDPSSQSPNCIGSAMPRSRKRSKMIKSPGPPPVIEHFEAANGVISQETLLGKVAPTRSTLESETTFSHLSNHRMSTQADDHCAGNKATISDVPVPLATKIYYSYGNHGLRTTLGHLYHDNSTREHTGQIPNDKAFLPTLTHTIAAESNNSSQNHTFDGKQEKVDPLLKNEELHRYPHLVHTVDQSLAQSQNFSHGNQLDYHQL